MGIHKWSPTFYDYYCRFRHHQETAQCARRGFQHGLTQVLFIIIKYGFPELVRSAKLLYQSVDHLGIGPQMRAIYLSVQMARRGDGRCPAMHKICIIAQALLHAGLLHKQSLKD